MTRLEDRQTLANHIKLACAEGARLEPACELAGIDPGTLRRWQGGEGPPQADRRPDAVHPTPAHALTEAERARIIEVANQPRFADAPPARIVPALADEGVYIASESSFHLYRHRATSGVVLGRDFLAELGAGTLVLHVHDPRHLQPQDRRLRGA